MVYTRSDFLHPVQFCSSKEGPDNIVQSQPGSCLDGLVKFWPNGSDLDARIIRPGSGRMQLAHCQFWPNGSGLDAIIIRPGSGRMQLAHCQFYTFRHNCLLPQIILCKTNMDLIWFWLTVLGFGQTDLVWKQAGVQESSGLLLSRSGSGANQISHVY